MRQKRVVDTDFIPTIFKSPLYLNTRHKIRTQAHYIIVLSSFTQSSQHSNQFCLVIHLILYLLNGTKPTWWCLFPLNKLDGMQWFQKLCPHELERCILQSFMFKYCIILLSVKRTPYRLHRVDFYSRKYCRESYFKKIHICVSKKTVTLYPLCGFWRLPSQWTYGINKVSVSFKTVQQNHQMKTCFSTGRHLYLD